MIPSGEITSSLIVFYGRLSETFGLARALQSRAPVPCIPRKRIRRATVSSPWEPVRLTGVYSHRDWEHQALTGSKEGRFCIGVARVLLAPSPHVVCVRHRFNPPQVRLSASAGYGPCHNGQSSGYVPRTAVT